MVIGKLQNSYKWKICYQLAWFIHRGGCLNRKGKKMVDLLQWLQYFAICGLVVPFLQDWRTLALACVSPWRVGGGALQASGLQLHPSTLANASCTNLQCTFSTHYLHKLTQYCNILYSFALYTSICILPRLCTSSLYFLYILHELYIKPFPEERSFAVNVSSALLAM